MRFLDVGGAEQYYTLTSANAYTLTGATTERSRPE